LSGKNKEKVAPKKLGEKKKGGKEDDEEAVPAKSKSKQGKGSNTEKV